MNNNRIKITIDSLPTGHTRVSREVIASANQRIGAAMKLTTREFQKKQKVSLERATQIVLNA